MNNFLRMLRAIFPPPRRTLCLWDVVPLVLFLCLFGGVWLWLELTHRVTFLRPQAAGLLIFAPWIWWMQFAGYSGLSPARGRWALWTRWLLMALFIMVLADPRAIRESRQRAVMFAVDVSDSIGEKSVDSARDYVLNVIAEKPQKDEAGLVTFGGNSAVELPPRTTFPLEAFNSRIDRDSTNLEQALSLSAAMLPEDKQGQIVLITDGVQTSGSTAAIVDNLKSRGIAVDVLPIQYQYEKEVFLERLELPQNVKIGENYEAIVILNSLQAGSGKLVLRENGQTIFQQTVNYQAGKNRYTIPLYFRNPGYYEYAATIEAPGDDHIVQNNTILNSLFLSGEGRVLLVVDSNGNKGDWQNLAEALREEKRVVEVKNSLQLSNDSAALMGYDCVVLVNVPSDQMDVMQQQALKSAVNDLGIGLLMIGGENSFGAGGYHRSPLEEALPVSMDVTQKKVLPKGCLAIILHTCEFPEGNTWAKRITKQAIQVLGEQDEAGVLNYDTGVMGTGERWVFKPTPVKDYENMVKLINNAAPGDMPTFAGTMQLALAELKKSDAATKHLIIISDGDPSPPPPPLVQQYVAEKISVTMVAIFPHGGEDLAVMRAVANATGGRYYLPSDPEQLPGIFIKESKTLKRNVVQERTFTPEVEMPSPILKGISTMAPLHGFVLTTPKSRSETILKAPVEKESEGDIDPILAKWRFGLGTSAAFTADLGTRWGKDWLAWDHYRPLLKQLMIDISKVKSDGHLRMNNYLAGTDGVIVVEDFHPQEMFLDIQGKVTDSRGGRSEGFTLKQIAPRRYQAKVPLWGKGRYLVSVEGKSGQRVDRVNSSWIVSYSPEYLRFRSNPILLQEIAEKTGGRVLTADPKQSEIFSSKRLPRRSTRPIFDWFLAALACLLVLDVGVRRIHLDWALVKSWVLRRRSTAATTQMLGTLLERKQEVGQQFETLRERRPTRPQPGASPSQKPPGTPPSSVVISAPPPPPPKPEDSQSTTGRLLEMKRKRQQDDQK